MKLSRYTGKRLVCGAAFALAMVSPRKAAADSLGVAAAAPTIAAAVLIIGAIVTPIGAMVNVVEGTPHKEWGRASLAFGGLSVGIGSVPLIIGMVSETDRGALLSVGSIAVTLGVGGLLRGGINEAMLPEEDEGIPGRPRPVGGTMFKMGGQF